MNNKKRDKETNDLTKLLDGDAAGKTDSEELKKNGKKSAAKSLRVPLIVFGILLIALIALYFAGTVYLKQQEGRDPGILEAGNTTVQDGGEEEILDTEKAKEELLLRLMEEYELGMKDGKSDVLEQIRLSLEDGTSVIETLRPLYKDRLVVASKGRYHFIPIRESMKKNAYSEENLSRLESGEIQYLTDGEVTSYKGIDVSKFQGKIDWKKVAQDGVTFAFVRVGYRGYGTKGTLVTDDTAETNIKGANDAGVKVGVYFYTQAITEEEILEEVQLVLDLIKPYRIECPIVIDVERTEADGRMNALDAQKRTELVKLFCDTVAAAGYHPMVYHNMEMGVLMLDLEMLEDYDKWFAYYKVEMYYPYEYKIWQYSDKGKVDGIGTDVDLDIAFEPVWQE